MKNLCTYCNKSIVDIGDRRKNGDKSKCDWNSRKMHKKCYKKYQTSLINENMISYYLKQS